MFLFKDQQTLEIRTQQVENQRYDLISGQQCIRDLFLCLEANLSSWPDVCSLFNFKITHTSECLGCNEVLRSETEQLYIEIDTPPDNSSLSDYIEEYFNISSLKCVFCEEDCQKLCQKEQRSRLTVSADTEFFIIILSRLVDTLDGLKLLKNKVISTNDVYIRYKLIIFLLWF